MLYRRDRYFHVTQSGAEALVHLGCYRTHREAFDVDRLGSIGYGMPYGVLVHQGGLFLCVVRYGSHRLEKLLENRRDGERWLEDQMRILAQTGYVASEEIKDLETFLSMCQANPQREY